MVPITWISKNIAISPAFEMDEINHIKKIGIDAIVDLRSEDQDDADLIRQAKMEFFHVEVDDRYAPTRNQFDEILDFVNPLLNQDKKILIHCQNGYQRSPLLAITILIKRGMNVTDAKKLLKHRHPTSSFTPPQEEFIEKLK